MSKETPPPGRVSPDGGTERRDVNDVVVEEWIEETTPFERVYETIRRTYDPTSASQIADRARVSPTTARKHLRTLVNAGEVTTSREGQTMLYRRSETGIVTEHAQSLLAERTPEEIASGIAEMKTQIQEWRDEHGVDSPEELARELDIEDADSDCGALLREWQTTRRNLALAQATLAIGEASRTGHLTGTDTDDDGNSDTSIVV
ncbi:winged helix-turn-helix domain-containing protein [Natronomonas sp. F2-12]|jgi:DNA-binding MarR family transcriptional regulator|uniref:Winged helix-turn-helix domain-containing protein n=1 Tax=Natronomonas aquatica TaxID=2841590 RepID=A0A9R1D5L7_9EURY|nr:winged helix-turn-helix domain-containing protein [Natronomonas aquatica]MCQ4332002.1 winged helix-turn-helix domain-containing protein [Natronomonas aquatica]